MQDQEYSLDPPPSGLQNRLWRDVYTGTLLAFFVVCALVISLAGLHGIAPLVALTAIAHLASGVAGWLYLRRSGISDGATLFIRYGPALFREARNIARFRRVIDAENLPVPDDVKRSYPKLVQLYYGE